MYSFENANPQSNNNYFLITKIIFLNQLSTQNQWSTHTLKISYCIYFEHKTNIHRLTIILKQNIYKYLPLTINKQDSYEYPQSLTRMFVKMEHILLSANILIQTILVKVS